MPENSYGGAKEGVPGASGRADMENSLEEHTCARWGLRIVNLLVLIFGIVMLVFCGFLVADGSSTPQTLLPLIVMGVTLLFIGGLGVWASVADGTDRCCALGALKFYWWFLFFGTVFAAWFFAYCAANFSKIEDEVMYEFEENWEEIVADLPSELLEKVPQSCGGTKVDLCDFSTADSDTTGFADPVAPTAAEIAACAATEMEGEEGEDSVICVYEPPCAMAAMCLGETTSGDDCASLCREPTCTDTAGLDCGADDTDGFICHLDAEHCPDECTFEAGDDESCCDTDNGCTWYDAEEGEALCLAETVESTDDGRRLQDDAAEPEPDTIVLGSSEDFEAQCWSTIKDTIMAHLLNVAVCLGIIVFLQTCCLIWCILLLTPREAIAIIENTINIGMGVVGAVLFVAGVYWAATLDFQETMALTLPLIILGLFMLFLGIAFGYLSDKYECCAKSAWMIYSLLFVVMTALAIGALAKEDTVRDKVVENGDEWLDKFCDTTCYAEIEAKMSSSRSTDNCTDIPTGDSECAADYEWAADKHLDIACNSTAPNTISQVCECQCTQAQALADVKQATDELIITGIMGSINAIGWLCILIAIYLLIEVFAHCYTHGRHVEKAEAKADAQM